MHDPVPTSAEAQHEYGIELIAWDKLPVADAMIAAVAHETFLKTSPVDLAGKIKPKGCFVDVKSAFDTAALKAAGLRIWRL